MTSMERETSKIQPSTWRWIGLIFAVAAIVVVIYFIEQGNPQRGDVSVEEIAVHMDGVSFEDKQAMYEPAKEITTPDGFINTDGVAIGDLVGQKVILVDFWTYSCINCQRTTPYLNAWYEQYADQGLEIIGIHTPEFTFEEEYENVQQAVEQFGIEFPVVLDNDYSTWRAYENRFWPRKYLIDIDGFIVYDHIGEGAYEETEMKIRELLAERAERLGTTISSDMATPVGAVAVDFARVETPEIYFGASRNERLGNGLSGRAGEQSLAVPENLEPHILYLRGTWDIESEFARSVSDDAQIVIQFESKEVYFVARALEGASIRLLLDGKPVDPAWYGADVANDGADSSDARVYIDSERLYHLISLPDYGQHVLEIIVDRPGLDAFTFTFG